MLFPILLSIAAVWVVGIVVTVVHLRRAPVAIEDETGFHVIEEVDAGKVLEFREAQVRAH
jgi:hypothetical protein